MTRTPRLRQILDTATEQAVEQGRSYIGVEHVMLAILADPHALPTQVLRRMGLDLEAITAEITATIESEGYNTPSRRVRLLDGTVVEP